MFSDMESKGTINLKIQTTFTKINITTILLSFAFSLPFLSKFSSLSMTDMSQESHTKGRSVPSLNMQITYVH